MKKIFIHPESKLCSVETDFLEYKKYIPLTRENINNYFQVSKNIHDCDFIFLGQITEHQKIPHSFKNLCNKYTKKVLVDIEGDFGSEIFPPYFKKVTVCAGGPDKNWGLQNCFVRPHLSKVLIELFETQHTIKNSCDKNLNFFFQGQINVRNRLLMLEALRDCNLKNIVVNLQHSWGANKSIKDSNYCQTMNDNLLSLCPRGVGGSSIRLYESCFFGCVPIVLGSDTMMGEDYYDTSFAFKLSKYNDKDEIINLLKMIDSSPKEQLINRGIKAREYYDNVVKPYLENPMKSFSEWLEKIKK